MNQLLKYSGMRTVILEGPIGAGKTTLLAALALALEDQGYVVTCAPEPVDQWMATGMLAAFYGDRERYAYSFQSLVFATRIGAICAAVARKPHADFLLLERSPLSDRIFMALQQDFVPEAEMRAYELWADTYDAMLPAAVGSLDAATVLYLAPTAEVCMARMAARARHGEAEVPLAYQQRLIRAHEARFFGRYADEFPQLAGRYREGQPIKVVPDGDFRIANGEVPFAAHELAAELVDGN